MSPPPSLSRGTLAQVACVLEVSASKPGNVHRFAHFEDSNQLDFLLSAAAMGAAFDRSIDAGIGAAVLDAVASTGRLIATNTNLGMILLLAPLAAVPADQPLQRGVAAVLAATTQDDARLVYQAIRQTRPGGLGAAPAQDVAGEPTVALLDAMRLAAHRDAIARQYATNYADVFDRGLPSLQAAIARGRPLETAIVATYLSLLAAFPDTLIARKRGWAEAEEASRRARAVLARGWPESAAGAEELGALDQWLRADGHARNPGATADLVAAALFAALHDGTIRLPVATGPAHWRLLPTR